SCPQPGPAALTAGAGRSRGRGSARVYADAEDGYNFWRTARRYYRSGLGRVRSAVRAWNGERCPLACVLQLGDLIDGLNAQRGASEPALRAVLGELAQLRAPVHHAWGNHDLYNFSREYLLRSELNSAPRGAPGPAAGADACYAYHFSPAAGFRFVMLDAYDLSVLGWDKFSQKYQHALKLLKEKNPNEDLNSPLGLDECQFVKFNGGFSQPQLDWFNEVLTASDKNREKVLVVTFPFIQALQTTFALLGIIKMPFPSSTLINVWCVFSQSIILLWKELLKLHHKAMPLELYMSMKIK
uniref:ADP-ribose/CDP-alcohol diphosphatase, manganese dependent n=1 Tax=Crocodylus porosus TaxID=8502 RepID=A0A7M4F2L3_CROPO